VTFADLERLFRSIFDGLELAGRGDMWRTHHIATIRKVRNRLSNISTRCKGLVTDDGPSSDLPWGRFEDRTVYVVDVANVDPLGQDLVFARAVSKLREHLERRDLGVDAVVVFVDELNKYAPGDGPETYVKKMLLDISERGRYLGLVLFGAEQFRSQVHRRVVGNAGTTVFGRMDSDELATPGYQVLSPATKIKLATLPIGELMVRHPHFTQPIFVRFPRPPVLRGRNGVERFTPALDLPFPDAVARQLLRLDRGVRPNTVKDLVAGRDEQDVRRALAETRRRRPDDVLAYFRKVLGSRVTPDAARERAAVPPLGVITDEPYSDESRMTAARRILPAGVALAAVLVGCGKSGPKVALRYHPPAGAVYHFALDQQSKIKFESGPAAAMGEQQLTMHMYFTQAVGDPSGNNIAVT